MFLVLEDKILVLAPWALNPEMPFEEATDTDRKLPNSSSTPSATISAIGRDVSACKRTDVRESSGVITRY
jgi:hypothetical protein